MSAAGEFPDVLESPSVREYAAFPKDGVSLQTDDVVGAPAVVPGYDENSPTVGIASAGAQSVVPKGCNNLKATPVLSPSPPAPDGPLAGKLDAVLSSTPNSGGQPVVLAVVASSPASAAKGTSNSQSELPKLDILQVGPQPMDEDRMLSKYFPAGVVVSPKMENGREWQDAGLPRMRGATIFRNDGDGAIILQTGKDASQSLRRVRISAVDPGFCLGHIWVDANGKEHYVRKRPRDGDPWAVWVLGFVQGDQMKRVNLREEAWHPIKPFDFLEDVDDERSWVRYKDKRVPCRNIDNDSDFQEEAGDGSVSRQDSCASDVSFCEEGYRHHRTSDDKSVVVDLRVAANTLFEDFVFPAESEFELLTFPGSTQSMKLKVSATVTIVKTEHGGPAAALCSAHQCLLSELDEESFDDLADAFLQQSDAEDCPTIKAVINESIDGWKKMRIGKMFQFQPPLLCKQIVLTCDRTVVKIDSKRITYHANFMDGGLNGKEPDLKKAKSFYHSHDIAAFGVNPKELKQIGCKPPVVAFISPKHVNDVLVVGAAPNRDGKARCPSAADKSLYQCGGHIMRYEEDKGYWIAGYHTTECMSGGGIFGMIRTSDGMMSLVECKRDGAAFLAMCGIHIGFTSDQQPFGTPVDYVEDVIKNSNAFTAFNDHYTIFAAMPEFLMERWATDTKVKDSYAIEVKAKTAGICTTDLLCFEEVLPYLRPFKEAERVNPDKYREEESLCCVSRATFADALSHNLALRLDSTSFLSVRRTERVSRNDSFDSLRSRSRSRSKTKDAELLCRDLQHAAKRRKTQLETLDEDGDAKM